MLKGKFAQILLVVEGLFERSDSIGYDCVFQYHLLQKILPGEELRIFASRFSPEVHPGLPVEPIEGLLEQWESYQDAILIYHYCDGWPQLDERLCTFPGRVILRWHNNTPPWFFPNASHYIERTIGGYQSLLAISSTRTDIEYWCNSKYTTNQLAALDMKFASSSVVSPGSRYLRSSAPHTLEDNASSRTDKKTFEILFVSRIAYHKGNRHILCVSYFVGQALGVDVVVHFPGRSADPEYDEELRQLALKLGVELRLPGEVTQQRLSELYGQADVFLCISEHEGFGIPVYEAARVGTPVVCWLATAFEEALQAHPLAFRELNYSQIASLVASVADPQIRSAVVRWQRENILPLYTEAAIEAQIRAALDIAGSTPAPAPTRDLDLELRVKTSADRVAATLADARLPVNEPPKEILGNFVTTHDLLAFSALIGTEIKMIEVEADQSRSSGLQISPFRFSRRGGRRDHDVVRFPLVGVSDHLIYGPFVHLPKGRYRAQFLAEFRDPPEESGPILFDVSASGQALAQTVVYASDRPSLSVPPLDFANNDEHNRFEFRVRAQDWASGELVFSGLTIERLPDFEAIFRRSVESLDGLFSIDRLESANGAATRRKKGLWFKSSAARAARERADAARDAGKWDDAARHYAEFLTYDETNFPIFVQYANCLKEAGRYKAAMDGYLKALDIAPTDADAHLQLGHLYKIMNRMTEAIAEYARAFACSRAGQAALTELTTLGLNVELVRSRGG